MPNDISPTKQAGTPMAEFRDPLLQIQFMDPAQKKDKDFGKTILQRIYKEQNNQSTTFYYGGRNIRWMENWEWAYGRQNQREFVDYVGQDGNKSYVNIDMTQSRIGPQFVETLVNSMSTNEEYPCVTAIDEGSVNKKEEEKKDALHRMHHADMINQLQTSSGLNLEPVNAYTPDDELTAKVHFELEHRLPNEIEFEKKLENVMDKNDYENLKRRVYRDLVVINCAATKIEKLDGGFLSIKKCIPANMIYNFFMSDSGKYELSYIGEIYSLKIRDLRTRYGLSPTNPNGLTEKEIHNLATFATQYNNANRFYYYWNDSYLYATDRPYDDYSIEVFDCELRCFDADYYVSKTDSYGKENIQKKKGIPKPESEKAKVIKMPKVTWYRGIYAIKANQMVYWGEPDVIVKPYKNSSESYSSYTINIPNNDGDYIPSLFERAMDPIREYALAKLKRKQILAELVPAGYTIDVEGIRDVDLGLGNVIGPEEIVKIYTQTGRLWWSSRGLNPNERQDIPIKGLPNAESIAQLNELTNVMATCKQEIRELLGVPQYRDGSDLGERTAAKLAQGQNQSSFNVTDFITAGYNQLMQDTLYKCCILEWDKTVLSKDSDRMDLLNTEFRVKVELRLTLQEKQSLESMISTAMQEGLLSFLDAFRIRQIKNYKLAALYLAQVAEKNKKDAAQAQQQATMQNAQAQQMSNQQQAENSAKMEMGKNSMQTMQDNNASKNRKEEILLQSIMKMLETGMAIPDFLQPVAQAMISNAAIGTSIENEQMKQDMAQAAAAQMSQQQQGPPQQQQGAPQQGQPQQQAA